MILFLTDIIEKERDILFRIEDIMKAEGKTKLINAHGFHVRPSTTFASLAGKFKSNIEVSADGGAPVDGKAIIMLMTLGASMGAEITVTASGEDAEEAVAALLAHIDDSFGGIP